MEKFKIEHFMHNGQRFVSINDLMDYCEHIINSKNPEIDENYRKAVYVAGGVIADIWSFIVKTDIESADQEAAGSRNAILSTDAQKLQ